MPERSDAARNRRVILDVAERLIVERGVDAVSMDDIAAAAGVGKGTLFRRFGDRAGLIKALVDQYRDERVQASHAASRHAATAHEHAVAYVDVLLQHVLRHLPLIAALEQDGGQRRYRGPNYQRTHRELAELITQARQDNDNAEFLAHVVLGAMRADLITHLLRSGLTRQQVTTQVLHLARQVLTPSPRNPSV